MPHGAGSPTHRQRRPSTRPARGGAGTTRGSQMFPQQKRPRLAALAAAGAVLALTAACSGGSGSDDGSSANGDGTPSGDLTVITWRTDLLEDGTLDGYKAEFAKKYP